MVLGIQVAGMLFGIFMMYYTFLKYKRKDLSASEYLFWMLLWILFVGVSLFPNWLDPLVVSLNFARTFDLLVTTGFLFILGVVFYTYTIVIRSRKQLEDLVRQDAIKSSKKDKKK